VTLEKATGRICAMDCGLFPPCTPLCKKGERVCDNEVYLLKNANHAFGLNKGKMLVYQQPKEE
jgi:arginine/lysine/ornithine decarboxylase